VLRLVPAVELALVDSGHLERHEKEVVARRGHARVADLDPDERLGGRGAREEIGGLAAVSRRVAKVDAEHLGTVGRLAEDLLEPLAGRRTAPRVL
jgi:hypothetical protein